MAYTNTTTNYGLPQYLGTDKASWNDNTTAFGIIDSQMKTNADNAASGIALANTNKTNIETINSTILTMQNNIAENTESISNIKTITDAFELTSGISYTTQATNATFDDYKLQFYTYKTPYLTMYIASGSARLTEAVTLAANTYFRYKFVFDTQLKLIHAVENVQAVNNNNVSWYSAIDDTGIQTTYYNKSGSEITINTGTYSIVNLVAFSLTE